MSKLKNRDIEIRSEEVNDILSRPPAWILRRGISVFTVILAAIFIGTVFFKYPDIVSAQITISAVNLPVHLKSKTSGKIERLFVQEGNDATSGSIVALIESATDYGHFITLQEQCDSFRQLLSKEFSYTGDIDMPEKITDINFPVHLSLGNIQSSYTQFLKSLADYKIFVNAEYHVQKIALIRSQMAVQREILHQGEQQLYNSEDQYIVQQRSYTRDSILFAQKVISETEMEQSLLKRLTAEHQYENLKSSIANMQLAILQSEQMIFELTQEQSERRLQLENTLTGSFDNLTSQMSQWEQTNLIISPIDGKVVFTQYWQDNQNVNTGDLVLSVIPHEKTGISGKLYLPIQGAGKVKAGQQVNIKLDNFPYMEFGMVEAEVVHISSVPIELNGLKVVIVDVEFPNGLITNYNLSVESGEEMNGTADIITEDISLFVRFFNPIKHLVRSRI